MQRLQAVFVFLFGTTRAALTSIICLPILIAVCYPPSISWVVGRILWVISPLITIAFVGFKLPKPKGDGK